MLNSEKSVSDRKGLPSWGIIFLLLCGVFFSSLASAATGLVNPGFESGLTDWSVTETVTGSVAAVGTEDGSVSPTYSDTGISISPFSGNQMARTANPKNISEKQERGTYSVSQTFVAESDSLHLAFWLLSWEHRGDDQFRLNLTSNGQAGYNVSLGGNSNGSLQLSKKGAIAASGTVLSNCVTPCEFNIDAGKRGKFVNTGWVSASIDGLTVGQTYKVEYAIIGGQNEAHASWAYFDNLNTPPVAIFDYGPKPGVEGDFTQFVDKSYDPDPGDKIVSWKWSIIGVPDGIIELQHPPFPFPDEGEHVVELTVTDSFGESTTVRSGELATDGTLVPEVVIDNVAPFVNAISHEVLAGEQVGLIGRFADPGFLDTHKAKWGHNGIIQICTAGADTGDAVTCLEENDPSFSTGITRELIDIPDDAVAGTSLTSKLTVIDNVGDRSSSTAKLQVVDATGDMHESGSDDVSTAPVLLSDWSYLAKIEETGDIDIFELKPDFDGNGQADSLPAGSEILVELSGLNADYDLIFVTDDPSSAVPGQVQSAPFFGLPFFGLPFFGLPYESTPFFGLPFFGLPFFGLDTMSTPFFGLPFFGLPFFGLPFFGLPFFGLPADLNQSQLTNIYQNSTYSEIPLSWNGYTTPEGSQLGGSDLSPTELGISSVLPDGYRIAAYSAGRGTQNEKIIIRTDRPDTKVYAYIAGANGAFNINKPYRLQVEMSRPLDIKAQLKAQGLCTGTPIVSPATPLRTLAGTGGGTQTLIVTQLERMAVIHGDVAALEADLASFGASHNAKVISLPSDLYDNWDINPCDVDAANAVTAEIRDIINDQLSQNDFEYIVFVGGDSVIPSRRVKDETSIGNESLYTSQSFVAPGTPLFFSLREGNILTDDYYVDKDPIPWRGRELYIADKPVARLIETPAQISKALNSYGPVLTASTAMLSSYEFFRDGTEDTAVALNGLDQDTLFSETWTADDLRCSLLGIGQGCSVSDISNPNAHYSHYAALSALGYNTGLVDILTSADIESVPSALEDKLVFSIGCHAGLNVQNGTSVPTGSGLLQVDGNLDLAETMARQGAIFAGSTGFGYGETEGSAGTERLMTLFAEEMAKGTNISVGKAMLRAKQRYIASLSTLTAYDEKSVIGMTLYGLPMSQVNIPVPTPVAAAPADYTFTLSIDDQQQAPVNLTGISKGSLGEYFAADGDTQVTAGRAIQPRVVVSGLTAANQTAAHGVLVTAGTYIDLPGLDPVISRPTQEWEQAVTEPQICLPAFWPSLMASINTVGSDANASQTLVVTPGQFRCDSAAAAVVTGTQRLMTSMNVDVLRSDSDDFTPPQITTVDIRTPDNTLELDIDTTDDSGISRIVVLLFNNGVVTPVVNFVPASGDVAPYTLQVDSYPTDARIAIQVVDGNGNVSNWTAKGLNAKPLRVDAGPDQYYTPNQATTLTATIEEFDKLVFSGNDVYYSWYFGDGEEISGLLVKDGVTVPTDVNRPAPIVVDANGTASFDVSHAYPGPDTYVATVKITDKDAGIGVDKVTIRRLCDAVDQPDFPNGDLVGCSLSNDADKFRLSVRVAGTIDPDFQYRVYLDLDNGQGGFTQIKYADGNVTGLGSLQAFIDPEDPQTVVYTFDRTEVDTSVSTIDWYAETQDGIKGGKGQGFVDRMPDVGGETYTIK